MPQDTLEKKRTQTLSDSIPTLKGRTSAPAAAGSATSSFAFSDPSASSGIEQSLARIAGMMDEIKAPLLACAQHMLSGRDSPDAQAIPLDKILSASPIASLLKDDTVNDILINGPHEIFIGKESGLEKTDITFSDGQSLRNLANAIAGAVGRHIDPRRPLVDARLKDGSRVNIIAPPMAVGGLTLSIRKFPRQEITLEKLIEKAEMTPQMAEFLKMCARSRVSLLVSGGTGTGKTTLLNAISRYIPESERIITIEDTAELRLQQPHVVRLETKEPQVIGERQEEVNASDLVRNALRMRPDRIIVGEVRGEEAYDMIQAMNTGHDGSMTTVHANTPRDAFTRVENLISPRMNNTPAAGIRHQIVSALNIVVQLVYNPDGKRLVSSITEIVGMEGDIPTMQEIFVLKHGAGVSGAADYQQQWTNIIPRHHRLSAMMRESEVFIPQ